MAAPIGTQTDSLPAENQTISYNVPMYETLLRTKLFAPPLRPNLVGRPQLVKHLNESLEPGHKLTLVSAPAGFGKTTVVREWLESLSLDGSGRPGPIRTSWLSLDENDNDLTRFLTYMVTALQEADYAGATSGMGALAMLQSAQPLPAELVLTSLVNDIAAAPDNVIHVLDDYHHIELPAVHEALTFLLENMPPQMHLVIVTRDDPHLPLARLRARGQLTEVRALDLRFSAVEADRFLRQVMGLDLSQEDIMALESRTEGWIVGLQLAAVAMQGRDDASELIKTFSGSHRFVLDYLMQEVLEKQSEGVQDFLLQTSILDRFTASLCDAVTGGAENGQMILQDLDHSNLFVVPLDGERRWYRYHHLFAELLRWRLRQSRPQEVGKLHLRAVGWLTQQGMYREAIRHAMAAGNYQGAADLIETIAVDIVQEGKHNDVIRWINRLPAEIVRERAYLCVLHAWALQLSGEFVETEARLHDAERCLAEQQPAGVDADIVLGMIASHRAYLTFFKGEHEQTIAYALQALEQLPPTVSSIRVQTALYLGVAYRYQGRLQTAVDVYREALPLAQSVGGSSTAMLCYLGLAELYCETAQLHRARALLDEALQFTQGQAGRPDMPFAGYVYVNIGRILRQWNRLDEAYRFTAKGIALVREWNVPEIVGLSCIEWAYILLALDHGDEARSAVQEAMQISESYSPWSVKLVAAHRAKMDLALQDVNSAAHWAEANDLDLEGDFAFNREIEYFSLARLFIAQERLDEAQTLAQRLWTIAQEIGKRQTELEALVLLALVLSAKSKKEEAMTHLEQAAAIGEAEGYVRVFVDEGRPMARLLKEALHQNVAPDYMRHLLAAFPADESMQAQGPTRAPDQSQLLEPLSERELEILQLIAEGLTNRQVAERLYLSLNTVKVHTRNIYGKLGVHSRTQAVAAARAMGVLPSD